jgi:hypothetical protein
VRLVLDQLVKTLRLEQDGNPEEGAGIGESAAQHDMGMI